jgi:hypothetical protein
MSIQTKAVLTAYYNATDKPVEANYTALIDSCYQGYLSKHFQASGNVTFYLPLGDPSNTYTIYKIYVYGVGGSGSSITSVITYESASASVSVSASSVTSFANTGYAEFFDKTLVATAVPVNSLLKVVLSSTAGTWSGGVMVLYSVAT